MLRSPLRTCESPAWEMSWSPHEDAQLLSLGFCGGYNSEDGIILWGSLGPLLENAQVPQGCCPCPFQGMLRSFPGQVRVSPGEHGTPRTGARGGCVTSRSPSGSNARLPSPGTGRGALLGSLRGCLGPLRGAARFPPPRLSRGPRSGGRRRRCRSGRCGPGRGGGGGLDWAGLGWARLR